MKKLGLLILISLLINVCGFSQNQSEESAKSSREQLQQELDQVKERLQGIIETETELKADREELKQLIISNNETIALKMMASLRAACESFRAGQKLKNFPKKFTDLKGYISDKIINATSSSQAALGYYYDYQYVLGNHFKLRAIPAVQGQSGERTFVLDDSGLITEEQTGEVVNLE